jgi:short-subunit dehydrogenase
MRRRGTGRILNVASAAAFMPGPLHAVYYASKAYVLSLSEALAIECAGSGVTVTAVCPGPVQTGFLARAGGPEANVFHSLGSRRVAEISYAGMLAGERVVVPGRTLRWITTLAPRSWLARQTARRNELILKTLSRAQGQT